MTFELASLGVCVTSLVRDALLIAWVTRLGDDSWYNNMSDIQHIGAHGLGCYEKIYYLGCMHGTCMGHAVVLLFQNLLFRMQRKGRALAC